MSSWKNIEDITLCESWYHATHDRITGNEMDKREMWSRITKAFCNVHGKDARTSQGLQGRWKKLNASFTCWRDAISHASGNLCSGTSLADQLTIILFIFMHSTRTNLLIYLISYKVYVIFMYYFLCNLIIYLISYVIYVIYMHSTRINILNDLFVLHPHFFNTILSHIFIDTTSTSILQFKEPQQFIQQMRLLGIVKDSPKYKVVPTGPELVMHSVGLHSSPEPDTAQQEADTFEDTEEAPEQVPETQPTRHSLRPQGKKASKKKGSSSRNDYTKYMEELARQGELTMARENARDEEKTATMTALLAATEARDAAAERQREILNRENELIREALHRENEMLREERMAQVDRDTMNKSLVGLSPNSKYFWTTEKRDVVRRRRARDAETSGGGSSYRNPSNENPTTTYLSSTDFV